MLGVLLVCWSNFGRQQGVNKCYEVTRKFQCLVKLQPAGFDHRRFARVPISRGIGCEDNCGVRPDHETRFVSRSQGNQPFDVV